ncbi:Hypotetical protein [Gulosibacter molinativorax]|nr:Hypotetical protein [Gulosibacter molinativorax]
MIRSARKRVSTLLLISLMTLASILSLTPAGTANASVAAPLEAGDSRSDDTTDELDFEPYALPPDGYPLQQVMGTASNPVLGSIPIRRGYFDSDTPSKGFGYDKAYHKHNIRTIPGLKWLLQSPNDSTKPQNNGCYDLISYVSRQVCTGTKCQTVEQIKMHAIYSPALNESTLYNVILVGKFGLVTSYCEMPNSATKCPDWVTTALNSAATRDGITQNTVTAPPVSSSIDGHHQTTEYTLSREPIA